METTTTIITTTTSTTTTSITTTSTTPSTLTTGTTGTGTTNTTHTTPTTPTTVSTSTSTGTSTTTNGSTTPFPYDVPSLKGWHGRPILYSTAPCWHNHLNNSGEAATALVMGICFIMITAAFAEGLRCLREALEARAVILIGQNTVDVNSATVRCDPNDKECIRVVEEVVSPTILSRGSWAHVRNSILYGIQCCLQMVVLFGALSLNIGLIVAALVGVFLGRLMFHWRPKHPYVPM